MQFYHSLVQIKKKLACVTELRLGLGLEHGLGLRVRVRVRGREGVSIGIGQCKDYGQDSGNYHVGLENPIFRTTKPSDNRTSHCILSPTPNKTFQEKEKNNLKCVIIISFLNSPSSDTRGNQNTLSSNYLSFCNSDWHYWLSFGAIWFTLCEYRRCK